MTSSDTPQTMGPVLDQLFATISDRKSADPNSSYTAQLFAKGVKKVAQKVGEEGVETALAAVTQDHDEVVKESADLMYHMMVLWAACDIPPTDVLQELARREGLSGLEEKAARAN